MSSQKVLLLGATGQTGGSILNGLLKHGGFQVEALVRPASAEKPDVAKLKERSVKIRIGDISGPTEDLVKLLQGFDTVISAIDAGNQLAQISLATAAKEAGIKRFVPCGFITICPPKGVLTIRDQKEDVYNHIKKINLPYTFIDVGYWHQLSFPTLPSGKVDYAALRKPTDIIHSDGKAPNLLTDLRDVGNFVARIVSDERTLNKQVVTWGDELSENEIYAMMEEVSGEKLTTKNVSAEETTASAEQLTKLWIAEPSNVMYKYGALSSQYDHSKYVRVDNTLEKAKYLGYLDARELYPDFKPISFRDFLKELLEGTIVKPYANLTM